MKLEKIDRKVIKCQSCPRLYNWTRQIAKDKRAAFKNEPYWGKPVPSFGSLSSQLLILGLAPAAHGANRTGRMFTGDRSGDWLYRSLYKYGFANQARSESINDSLTLKNCRISASIHCAPPQNKPLKEELENCFEHLQVEFTQMKQLKVILALGGISWNLALKLLASQNKLVPKPKPKFGHLSESLIDNYILLGSYHPSQQNTFTGRLTQPMFDQVFKRINNYLKTC